MRTLLDTDNWRVVMQETAEGITFVYNHEKIWPVTRPSDIKQKWPAMVRHTALVGLMETGNVK